eukprot:00870_5
MSRVETIVLMMVLLQRIHGRWRTKVKWNVKSLMPRPRNLCPRYLASGGLRGSHVLVPENHVLVPESQWLAFRQRKSTFHWYKKMKMSEGSQLRGKIWLVKKNRLTLQEVTRSGHHIFINTICPKKGQYRLKIRARILCFSQLKVTMRVAKCGPIHASHRPLRQSKEVPQVIFLKEAHRSMNMLWCMNIVRSICYEIAWHMSQMSGSNQEEKPSRMEKRCSPNTTEVQFSNRSNPSGRKELSCLVPTILCLDRQPRRAFILVPSP